VDLQQSAGSSQPKTDFPPHLNPLPRGRGSILSPEGEGEKVRLGVAGIVLKEGGEQIGLDVSFMLIYIIV